MTTITASGMCMPCHTYTISPSHRSQVALTMQRQPPGLGNMHHPLGMCLLSKIGDLGRSVGTMFESWFSVAALYIEFTGAEGGFRTGYSHLVRVESLRAHQL